MAHRSPAGTLLLVAVSCLAAIPFLPAAARAQDRPNTLPTRDVDVTYRVSRGGATVSERMRWLAGPGLQRVDPPGDAMHMIMDHHSHHVAMVSDAHREVVETDAVGGALDPGAGGTFTRRGEDTVASIGCTLWDTGGTKAPVQLCLTADGVLLRVKAGGATLVEATQVQYGPQNPADFQVPADYRRVTPSATPGAGTSPPAK
jgi:hypothetical protein